MTGRVRGVRNTGILCFAQDDERLRREQGRGDEGFMLIGAIVLIFMVLLVLSVAAPTMARSIQHDRELESEHRAQQYVRAVRVFYLLNKRYPTSIEQLEKTNNRRYLRQRYIDPLTGKSDWRLIHVGENQTTVKGFFGEDLPGLQTSGLGSAAGMASTTGGSTSAFGSSSAPGTGGSTSAFGGTSSPTGGGSTSAFGSTSTPGQSGTSTGTGTGTGAGAGNTNGIASQDATTFTGGSGGPIIGVGSARSGEAMLVVNEQTSYETWEFLYDPRIEALYAKSTLLGGVASGSATGSSSFGSGTGNSGASPMTNGFGGNPPTGAGGSGGNGATGSPTGTTPP
jgi:type II secretory pathway pseudopilin PulG